MAYIQERKDKNGNLRYRVLIRIKGYPAQSETFARKTDAKLWAQQIESEIRQGKFNKTLEGTKHTLAEASDKYLKEVASPNEAKKCLRNTAQHLQWWKKALGHVLLNDLTPSKIAQARDALLSENIREGKRRSPGTVVRYMASLSVVLTACWKEWQWLYENPFKKVTKPKEPRGRVRFLDDEERFSLLKACKKSSNSYLYPFVVLALSTGMRKGEIINLTWKDVDLEKGRIVLHQTKNGERRVVPVQHLALDLLIELKLKSGGKKLLFPSSNPDKPIDLRHAWEESLKEANIQDFRFHDLRHSAASYLAMSGAHLLL